MIRNLKDELFACTGEKQDSRFSSWAKEIAIINNNEKGAYRFVGPFVGDGTVKVLDMPHLYLVASTDGSRKYQLTKYNVVKMSKEGELSLTDIADDNSIKGWEFRIQAQVEKLLAEISPSPITSSIKNHLAIRIQKNLERYGELKSELERQVKKCLEAQEGFMGFTSGVQVQLILNVSEQMLGRIHQPEKWDALLETFCKTAVEEIKGEK